MFEDYPEPWGPYKALMFGKSDNIDAGMMQLELFERKVEMLFLF
jgi:hypothetical protein